MYYYGKFAQAAGLAVIGIGFLANFPSLMSMKIFAIGTILFLFGWIIEHYLLKPRKDAMREILKFDTGADGFKKMIYVLAFLAVFVLLFGSYFVLCVAKF